MATIYTQNNMHPLIETMGIAPPRVLYTCSCLLSISVTNVTTNLAYIERKIQYN